jgi:hypothetical protein
MPSQVVIYSATSVTPPFSGTVCDFYGNNCTYVGSGTTFPITYTLPPLFNTAPVIKFTITDSVGCTLTETMYCSLAAPKQFQNLDYFFFMSGDIFQFQ